MKKNNGLIISLIVLYVLLIGALLFDFLVLGNSNYFALVILLVGTFILLAMYFGFNKYHNLFTSNIESSLNSSVTDALKEGNVGILVYNEDYEITWLSNMFNEKEHNQTGEKLLDWLPELQDLVSGKAEKATVVINDDKYSVTKKDDAYVLFFNDITKEYDLSNKLEETAPVLGLVNFDNFDELSLSEDEIAFVNTYIKAPVMEYFRDYGAVYKTLRNNRLQLILNYQIYQKLLDDRFSILNKVRKEAKTGEVDVTLSASFAYGSESLEELDDAASSLLEVAQTRGGDQVVVKELGKDAVFYGGSSEAREKQNKTKVRVFANTLRKMIEESSNVIIIGHKDADADCVGASLAISLVAKNLDKEAYILLKTESIEPMIKEVLSKYDDLSDRHNFVNRQEALAKMDDNTLVVMVDHHSKINSNGADILEKAKKIAIIDHHRRRADLDVDASFMYVEAGASSTVELMVEMFPYFVKNIDMEKEEANIMYIGLLIDTNHFRNRTDTRTFDVAKYIKQYGVDSIECEELMEEPYEMFKKRNEIINYGKRYTDNIMIANCVKGTYPRSIASQAVDRMTEIKEIEAAFVICKLLNGDLAISARSNGKINVQLIIEKLGGGGHMTAAGLQIKDGNQEELYKQLTEAIDSYLESVKEDESNSIE